jgi:hypothetical protein
MNTKAEREVRRDVYKILLGKVQRGNLSNSVNRILEMHRRMLER